MDRSDEAGMFATFEDTSGLTGETGETEVERLLVEERATNRHLDDIFSELKGIREPKEAGWATNIQAFRGDRNMARPRGLSRAQFNNIWRIANLTTALLTDGKPRPEIGSRRPTLHKLGKVMREVVEAIFFLQDLNRKIVRWSYDIQMFGRGFAKVIWDPGLEWGEGDVSILRIDPRYMYVDDVNDFKSSQVICYRTPVPLWELQALYPSRGHLVTPDVQTPYQDTTTMPSRLPAPIRPTTTTMGGIPRAWTEEWWIRDPQKTPGGVFAYPSGRMIVRAGGQKTLLASVRKPYYDPWPGPWAVFEGVFDPDSPWPVPDVQMLVPMQDSLDNLMRYVEDNANFLTAGMWMAEQGSIDEISLETKTSLIPSPGKIVWYRRGGKPPARDAGPPLPASLVDVIRMLYQGQESVAGLMDPAKSPQGPTSGASAEALQAGTLATIRLRGGEIETGLATIGQWVINRVLEFYTEKRILNMLGPAGTYDIEWDPSPFQAAVDGNVDELPKLFRFMITPGSSLALSRDRQYAMHAALYSMGAIDREALLTAIDYPGKDEIMRRMSLAQQGMPPAKAASGPSPRGRGAAVTRKLLAGLTGGSNTGGGAPTPGQ